MIFQGALQKELSKGFSVSDEELAEAQQALFPADDRRWSELPLEMTPSFYKEKISSGRVYKAGLACVNVTCLYDFVVLSATARCFEQVKVPVPQVSSRVMK